MLLLLWSKDPTISLPSLYIAQMPLLPRNLSSRLGLGPGCITYSHGIGGLSLYHYPSFVIFLPPSVILLLSSLSPVNCRLCEGRAFGFYWALYAHYWALCLDESKVWANVCWTNTYTHVKTWNSDCISNLEVIPLWPLLSSFILCVSAGTQEGNWFESVLSHACSEPGFSTATPTPSHCPGRDNQHGQRVGTPASGGV